MPTTTRDHHAETLPAHAVLDGLLDARRAAHDAQVAEVELAVQWAALHPAAVDAGETAGADDQNDPGWQDWHELAGESTLRLAGPGAPTVAEFCLAEVSATLQISHFAARRLVAESLELVHRLPRVWAQTQLGRLPVWRARAIAALTVDLDPDAVAHADRLLAATPSKITTVHAHRLVHEARLYADPDIAAEDERQNLDRRGVWLNPGTTPAVTGVHMLLDSRDAHLLDQTLNRVAGDLKALGDTDSRDARRATAAGILADPQHALDLMTGDTYGHGYGYGHPIPDQHADRHVTVSPAGPAVRVRKPAPSHTVYVHLTLAELIAAAHGTGTSTGTGTGTGHGTIERMGPATTDLINTWLTDTHPRTGTGTGIGSRTDGGQNGARPSIRVRPVLDLASDPAIDRHDPPPLMRELVQLRDAHCVFPGCHRDSRSCDLDHVEAYTPLDQGGAPGQTRPSNLAPLCRTHHRVKTHGGWTYTRTRDDAWQWTTPTGRVHVVRPASRRPPEPPRLSEAPGQRRRNTWSPLPQPPPALVGTHHLN